MPSSYLMSRRFSYRRLKKLPTAAVAAPPDVPQQLQEQYYAAITAAAAAAAQHGGGGGIGRRRRRRMRPRLRISRLARVLRRKAAAVGGAVRASVAKVVRRLREGSPYVGDLLRRELHVHAGSPRRRPWPPPPAWPRTASCRTTTTASSAARTASSARRVHLA
ncbi:hypothetical protein OsJ_04707 [Oryza sativa Japonica Group]|uniref:Uncharacterized protein n=1 Tax=Oryza sativa subsp. japonica TaxID=39947 RepID=B9EWD2_ORYSJ|nr:hypothetical protein OsJ_04707 [Oryza sativa Japonica Group]